MTHPQDPLQKKKTSALQENHRQLEVAVTNQLRSFAIQSSNIKKIVNGVAEALGLEEFHVSVAFVGTAAIKKLNAAYRQKDYATDVLSFGQIDWPSPLRLHPKKKVRPRGPHELLLGDIVISLPNAKKNAASIGQGIDREVCFLLIHAMLHLCGHDHMAPREEQVMLKLQNRILAALAEIKSGPTIWKNCVQETKQDRTKTRPGPKQRQVRAKKDR
jgi:probable rRNA maturation factor